MLLLVVGIEGVVVMKIKKVIVTVVEIQMEDLHPLIQKLIQEIEQITGCLVSVRVEELLLHNYALYIHVDNELDGELWNTIKSLTVKCQIQLDKLTGESYNIYFYEELRPYPQQTLD